MTPTVTIVNHDAHSKLIAGTHSGRFLGRKSSVETEKPSHQYKKYVSTLRRNDTKKSKIIIDAKMSTSSQD